jgi:outer membrane protein assembly factor BamB
MKHRSRFLHRPLYRPLSVLGCLCLAMAARADHWPAWRGPAGDGTSAEKGLPVRWSATENVRWKVELHGAGVSAPIVWGDHLFLTSSEGRRSDRLSLACYHCNDGRLLWRASFFGSTVPEGQFPPGGMAVPTPATYGRRVYALFGTGDLVCVDFDGKPVWLRSLAQEYGPFRNRWGMAASPVLVGDLLVVQVDHWGKSYLLGIEAATGRNRWKTGRDVSVNWTSPLAVQVAGKTQIVAVGTETVKGYDAATGAELWTVRGVQTQCIPSPVARDGLLYAISGRNHYTLAIRLDGRTGDLTKTHVQWKARGGAAYVPSPVCLGRHYYYVEDNGWGNCLDAVTGKRVWRERMGSKHQASLVAGDGKVYFTGETGVITVVKAGEKFEVLAKNDLEEDIVASPAVSGGRLFIRGSKHLFCIGQ